MPPSKEELRKELHAVKQQLDAYREEQRQFRAAIGKQAAKRTGLNRRDILERGGYAAFGAAIIAGSFGAGVETARADAAGADAGTQADPYNNVWSHIIESGDGANALGFGDAVAFDHEAVSSATTIGNVTLVIYDSSASSFTITIPSSLEQNGMVVRFIDQTGNADTNNVTVENSSNSTILTLDAADTIFEVWWDGSEWLDDIITDTLDARKLVAESAVIGSGDTINQIEFGTLTTSGVDASGNDDGWDSLTATSVTVSFSTTFDSEPMVIISNNQEDANVNGWMVRATAIGTASFDAQFSDYSGQDQSGGTYAADWVAIG